MPKTVLIAEDNRLNRQLFADVLTGAGYRVIEAEDGPAALDAARRDAPDLLLLDMDLPGLSGAEVARRLRVDVGRAHMAILAISAHAEPAVARHAAESGCDGWMTKPVRPDALTEAVGARIGAACAADAEG